MADSAKAGADYTEKHGTLTFPAGKTEGTIEIPIRFDEETKEDDEVFFVELSNPVNASLDELRGKGTIQNTHVSFVGLRRALWQSGAGAFDIRHVSGWHIGHWVVDATEKKYVAGQE